MDVTEVVIVVAVAERLVGDGRCFFRGRTSLMSHSGSLTRAWISWCACRVASAGPLKKGGLERKELKNVNLKLGKTTSKWSAIYTTL